MPSAARPMPATIRRALLFHLGTLLHAVWLSRGRVVYAKAFVASKLVGGDQDLAASKVHQDLHKISFVFCVRGFFTLSLRKGVKFMTQGLVPR